MAVTHFASTRPKISMDDTYRPLPPGYCQFELTVGGATDLCKMHIWSQNHGGYVAVAIGGTEIHKTHVAESEREPEWNDTFQFVAKRDDYLTISIHTSGRDILGKFEESLKNADCTGEEISRSLTTQDGTPFKLKFRFAPRSRLFGLIIGIDRYQSDDIRDLRGCKADAQSMVNFLSKKFHIRSSHFLCLANERATRSAIISGFQDHLIENDNIERGDAIVFFYAGHGSRAAAPKGWIADDNQVETICPHDERTYLNRKEVFGIPDKTIGGLLRKVCAIKGDNITVICDACHSAGNTRTSRVARRASYGPPLPEGLDQNIREWGLFSTGKADTSTGFLDQTMSSHVLLAACKQDEVAFEDPLADNLVRGAFTHSLIELMDKAKDLTRITYSALVEQLPPLQHQHPQCNGKNKGRALFGGVVNHPTLFKLSRCGETYSIEAGAIQGVVKGTPFAIHALGDIASTNSEIGILEADSVLLNLSILRRRRGEKFDIPPNARALMLNWRPDANVLKVFVQPPHDVKSIEHVFSLVDDTKGSDLMILRTHGDNWQFERLDPIMSKYKYARVLDVILHEPNWSDVLQGVSDFNFHLSRCNIGNPLKQSVKVVLHRLIQINPDQISKETIYMPDGDTSMLLAHDRENTVFASETDLDSAYYGLSVTNNSGRDLFPYLFYFDPSDYSIQSWYHPPAEIMAPPLPKDNGPSELRVGYGAASLEAFQFSLPSGVSADAGFLKVFVSSKYVDMSVLEQSSPFLSGRGGKKVKTTSPDVWDSWTYVLKTARK